MRWTSLVRTVALVAVVGAVATACGVAPYDFDGGGRTTLTWFDDSTHQWKQQDPGSGVVRVLLTTAADEYGLGGDFDGDGRYDLGVVRPGGTLDTRTSVGIIPVPQPASMVGGHAQFVYGAYDEAHRTLPAMYRPGDATWWISGHAEPITFGVPYHADGLPDWDLPVPADYDGDGRTDIATFSPLTGAWKVLGRGTIATFGPVGAFPVPADWDGDGVADPAYVSGNEVHVLGQPTIVAPFPIVAPVLGDVDGDGRVEPGSYEAGTWRTSVHGGPPGSDQLVAGPIVVTGSTAPAAALGTLALVVNIARLTALRQCVAAGASTCPGTY